MNSSKQVNKSLNDWIVKTSRAIQADLLQGIKKDTPVDTGRAQAGWESSNQVNKVGDTGVIENLVPYIGWLEFGNDRSAPVGMVRNNINRVKGK
jgi:hypothetical protein